MMGSLVTVIISTYNSGKFITETLESVADQTWKDLELVITDDCSGDDTVGTCKAWLASKSTRFISSKVITSEKNTGVSGNANRGLTAASGEWIKFLGADDTLKPSCIEDNMAYVAENPEVRILFSQIDIFKDTFESASFLRRTPELPYNSHGLLADWRRADSQYRMLLVSDRIHFSPSMFIHRDTINSVGGFDERFRMLEDYPLWLKLTRAGNKLHFMEKVTVNYRQHSAAINNTGNLSIVNPNYFRAESFRKIYVYPNLPADIKLNERYRWIASQLFRCDFLNRDIRFNKLLYRLFTIYLNPFRYLIYIRKRLVKSLINNEFYS